jgi:hypothetical protein
MFEKDLIHEKPKDLKPGSKHFYVARHLFRDQCFLLLHLFEQRHFGIHFLGDLLDAPIVFRDALLQRCDFP